MEIRLDRRRALVTGASSGIGQATAIQLGRMGACVAVNYRRSEGGARETAEAIRACGAEAMLVQGDVSKIEDVGRIFGCLDDAWGGVDILVNNAGIEHEPALAWELEPQTWRKNLAVDLDGAFYCARQALSRMVEQGRGVIVNVSSVHDIIPWKGHAAYAVAKAGLTMLTKTLAMEAAPCGVRVVGISPGAIRTSINEEVWSNPVCRKDLEEKVPMDRIGEPEEIARMIAVLVSDVASYVTGATLYVDGGMTLYPSFEAGG